MKPTFWKMSQGKDHFKFGQMLQSIYDRVVVMYGDTDSPGPSPKTQSEDFEDAPDGDYFYLTNGNEGIFLLGQFDGPVNHFSRYKSKGWIERPFKLVAPSLRGDWYEGKRKRWTPNDPSTFSKVPPKDLSDFEEWILKPYFGLDFDVFGRNR